MKEFFKENGTTIALSLTTILSIVFGLTLWIMCAVAGDLAGVVQDKNNEIEELQIQVSECHSDLIMSRTIVDEFHDLIDRGYLIENYPKE